MPANIFSPMIKQDVLFTRRIGHSFTNYFSSIDSNSFGFRNSTADVVGTAANVAGTVGAVGGAISIGMGQVAAGTVVGAGFLAAVAGPQVAVTTAVISLALLADATYSNRESAHKKLSDFVWNLVDNETPTKGDTFDASGLEQAAGAAITLLEDGKSQLKLLGHKLRSAQVNFQALNTEIENDVKSYNDKLNLIRVIPKEINRGQLPLSSNPEYVKVLTDLANIRTKLQATWDRESRPNGRIFEYVRRCSHTGNYLQAPHILSLAMQEKLSKDSVVNKKQNDFFAGFPLAKESRDAFTKLAEEYEKRNVMP
jgi:hypothetical protein